MVAAFFGVPSEATLVWPLGLGLAFPFFEFFGTELRICGLIGQRVSKYPLTLPVQALARQDRLGKMARSQSDFLWRVIMACYMKPSPSSSC